MSSVSALENKRKFSEVSVPPSLTSYLWGILSNDFQRVKTMAKAEHSGQFENKQKYLNDVLEEVFRYLLLVAENSDNVDVSSVSPSFTIVDKVLHCLILDPTLYHRVCDALLTHLGVSAAERPMRVLPHNPLGGDDANRNERYRLTLRLYKERFGEDPSSDIWNDATRSSTSASGPSSGVQTQLMTNLTSSSSKTTAFAASTITQSATTQSASRSTTSSQHSLSSAVSPVVSPKSMTSSELKQRLDAVVNSSSSASKPATNAVSAVSKATEKSESTPLRADKATVAAPSSVPQFKTKGMNFIDNTNNTNRKIRVKHGAQWSDYFYIYANAVDKMVHELSFFFLDDQIQMNDKVDLIKIGSVGNIRVVVHVVEDNKITISLRECDGTSIYFRIGRDTLLQALFENYTKRTTIEVPCGGFRYLLRGQLINGTNTPKMLEMQNDDQIDVMLPQNGC